MTTKIDACSSKSTSVRLNFKWILIILFTLKFCIALLEQVMNAQRVQLDAIPLPDAPTNQAGTPIIGIITTLILYTRSPPDVITLVCWHALGSIVLYLKIVTIMHYIEFNPFQYMLDDLKSCQYIYCFVGIFVVGSSIPMPGDIPLPSLLPDRSSVKGILKSSAHSE